MSYIKHGYTYHLYIYKNINNDIYNIPKEVIIKDANEILDSSEIFYYKNNSVSAFSNIFRFTLLYKKGGYWIDTDMFCIKKFIHENDYLFVSEPDIYYKKSVINAGILLFPKNDPILLDAINICKINKKKILSGEIHWGLGPSTVKYLVKKYNLYKYVKTWKFSNICNNHHFMAILKKNYTFNKNNIMLFYSDINKITNETFFIHTWNEKFDYIK